MATKRGSNWPKGGRHKPRKGKEVTPAMKRFILKRDRQFGCWLATAGVCTGNVQEVHHIVAMEDGGDSADPENLVGVCEPCHTLLSAQHSQRKAVEAAWDWRRKPERHPGVLD